MDRAFSTLVRHNVNSAVVADVERTKGGFLLRAVSPKDGPLPDVSHLVGGVYPDLAGIRRGLVAAMKTSKRDTLDKVLLTETAYHSWGATVNAAVQEAVKLGLQLKDVPDEMARALPDGSLLIYVDVPGWRQISLQLAPGEWRWRK